MIKKHILLLLLSAIISLPLAAEEEIRLREKTGNETGARTGFNGTIYASIDESVLTVSFCNQLNYCIDNYEYNTYITPAYGPAIDLMPVISDQGNIASSVFVNEHIKIENCSLNGFMHNYWTEDLTFKSLNLDGSVIQVSPNQFTRLDRDVKINNSTLIIK